MAQTPQSASPLITITGGSNSLIASVVEGSLVIHHWGSSAGNPASEVDLIKSLTQSVAHSDFDKKTWPGIFREHARGDLGSSALLGHREGQDWSTRFEIVEIHNTAEKLSFIARDESSLLQIEGSFEFDQFGILRIDYQLLNEGDRYNLESLAYWLPLPHRAKERMDFTGRWAAERQVQRAGIDTGLWVRQSREGRSGHDFTIAQLAMERTTNFSHGEVWSVALAWSGNSSHMIEKSYTGSTSIGATEVLYPGEVILEKGERYQAPTLVANFSNQGLDGLAANHHRSLRARKRHPSRPRPLTLNMWEAIYFDHSHERVAAIVDAAARIGVERVVLDDGWFGSRRDDRSGLGDWFISKEVWPKGLKPIADHVRANGMEFGLWFEGEMVNADSELYRTHPDWVLTTGDKKSPLWRQQMVLDLARQEVFDHILERVSGVIAEVGVSYIKWDHNRVLIDAGSGGRAAYRAQVFAIYRLFDQLKARHPGLEIESCASGGGRVDLGMIEHVDRFWTSDNNDALSRVAIQSWSAQVIPPELLGTHIGPYPNHQTGRHTPLSMRAAVALFGHAGIEWDFTQSSASEQEDLKRWIAFYKEQRDWLQRSKLVRVDDCDDAATLYGFISHDINRALFTYIQREPSKSSHPDSIRITGLDRDRKYRAKAVYPAGKPSTMSRGEVGWLEGVLMSGAHLSDIGLVAPILEPENALLIMVEAL